MLKYMIFILVFNSLCCAENNLEHKRLLIKRLIKDEPNSIIKLPDSPYDFSKNRVVADKNITKPLPVDNNKTASEATANKTGPIISIHLDNNTKKQDELKIVTNPTRKLNKDDNNLVWSSFYAFLGLSFVVITYFLVRAFRLRPGAPPPTTVRKYGIVGRRSDMEMLPLPLEEEDDDTVFEMSRQGHIH